MKLSRHDKSELFMYEGCNIYDIAVKLTYIVPNA